MSAENIAFGVTLYKMFVTCDPQTGGVLDANALPVGTLYRNGAEATAPVTVDKVSGKTGIYFAHSELSGYGIDIDDELDLVVEAAVATVSGTEVIWKGRVLNRDIDDSATLIAAGLPLASAAVDSTSLSSAAIDEIVEAFLDKTGLTAGGVVTHREVAAIVYAMARGRIIQDGDKFLFYDDDDRTLLFSWEQS